MDHITVRDLIKALADFEPTDEVVFTPGTERQLPFGPKTPIVAISSARSVMSVIAGKDRRTQTYAVLVGKAK